MPHVAEQRGLLQPVQRCGKDLPLLAILVSVAVSLFGLPKVPVLFVRPPGSAKINCPVYVPIQ